MDIILPVAGFGTRLRPQTWSKPKPLVSVAGKTMLEHVLDRVMSANPQSIVFITGFLGDEMKRWAQANLEIETHFVEQPEMRGQTDAIIRAREVATDDALILFPDALFEADFTGLDQVDADVVMYTKEVEDPSQLGIAVVEGGRIVKLIEKPKEPISNLAVIGIYYVRSMPQLYEAIDLQMERGIMTKNEYFIADAIQLMIDGGAKVVSAPVSMWEDCGNTEALLSTNRILLDRESRETTQRGDSVVVGPSVVHPSATVERSVIGPYASIGANAVVRGSIISDCIVEGDADIDGVALSHSVIGRKAALRGSTASLNVGDNSTVAL